METLGILAVAFAFVLLQWGHALLGVETKLNSRVAVALAKLQWGHALLGVETNSDLRPVC
ncbi:MAG: hypothetical protein D6709_00300 [Chloroflexi bacterium]|uniref:Uncharacterized protein n=1 Tax=Candidatus Thermofonsia Clade 3 bacterium TaxID=2364212 RepID=A0A2M8QA55_9CHLR|nr:MAG: hypothetical protein CUN48_12780 [Candidatus Thermofonsia Clade 3 bacterium]RMG66208.1 MAG: hypothetical protein D6709_00300 [Chloroflexota bacterium]